MFWYLVNHLYNTISTIIDVLSILYEQKNVESAPYIFLNNFVLAHPFHVGNWSLLF